MNRLLILPVMLLTLLVGNPASSADFQKGLDAALRGDYATALKEWTPLAEQGDADSQHNLGLMFYKGNGVSQDYKTAIKWFSLAAEKGDFRAQNILGKIYGNGEGVPRNNSVAIKWYRLSAEQGNAHGQSNLGMMYALGDGVRKNRISAYVWGKLAATNGDELGAKLVDFISQEMSRTDISTAQILTQECENKNYKGC